MGKTHSFYFNSDLILTVTIRGEADQVAQRNGSVVGQRHILERYHFSSGPFEKLINSDTLIVSLLVQYLE